MDPKQRLLHKTLAKEKAPAAETTSNVLYLSCSENHLEPKDGVTTPEIGFAKANGPGEEILASSQFKTEN
jgi:hypothetical protein